MNTDSRRSARHPGLVLAAMTLANALIDPLLSPYLDATLSILPVATLHW